MVWGVPAALGYAVLRSYLSALSRTLPLMILLVGCLVLSVTLNYALIFGHFAFPRLGIAGAGYANAIVQWVQVGALAIYVATHRGGRGREILRAMLRPARGVALPLLRLGWPIAGIFALEAGVFSTAGALAGRIGTASLAAHQVAISITGINFMVPLAFSNAATVRVALASGAGRTAAARRAGVVAMSCSAGYMVVMAIVLLLAPGWIISLYLDRADPANAEAVVIAMHLLFITALFQVFDGTQAVAAGALRGLRDTRMPLVIAHGRLLGRGIRQRLDPGVPAGVRCARAVVGAGPRACRGRDPAQPAVPQPDRRRTVSLARRGAGPVVRDLMAEKQRLDTLLVARGLVDSRAKAQAMSLAGLVWSGDRRLDKPGQMLPADTPLECRGRTHPWVSRGGIKLAHALDHFEIDPSGTVALDVGASTGGFTDVLLQRGAAKVYAVDVGHGQLDWKLRQDPRVVVLERTNARYLTTAEIPEPPGIVVCDASFISLQDRAAGCARPCRARCPARRADQAAIRGRQGPRRQRRGRARSGAARGGLQFDHRLARGAAGLDGAGPYREPDPRPGRQCRVPHRGEAGPGMRRRRRTAKGQGATVELDIISLGARGDGIARHDGTPVYVPFTVPGDRVLARLDRDRGEGRAASVEKLLVPGPGRAAPPCRHFGTCGGCAFQHLDADLYAATKLGIVRDALARQGFVEPPVAPVRLLPPGTRRRIRLTLERPPRKAAPARIGFAERASHAIVDLAECAVMHPQLFKIVAPLRALAANLLLPGEQGHATMQAADSGIDLLLDVPRVPDLAALEALASFAEAQDLARLAWRAPNGGAPVPVAQRRPVQVALGGVAVDLPVDGFLQATREAEAALTAEVLRAMSGATRIADLFAGVGTFTFALAAQGRVHAVEGWAPAATALRAAANRAVLAQRVTVEARDLEARPLEPDELAAYDAVVFDPPRNGAKAQAATLARSGVPCIAAVSCNPASFARDARALVSGGYRMVSVQPIDQFVWSPHVELVAAFRRE